MGMFDDFFDGGAGGIISGVTGMFGASQSNKAAQKAAQAQMDFQERMSSTAYQRTMADMKAAGLNPILASKVGGASSPSGASYVPQNELAPLAEGLNRSVSTSLEMRRQRAEISNLEASAVKLAQDAKTGRAVEQLTEEQKQKTFWEGLSAHFLQRMNALDADVHSKLLETTVSSAGAAKAAADIEKAIDSGRWGEWMRYLSRANPLGSSAKAVAPYIRGK